MVDHTNSGHTPTTDMQRLARNVQRLLSQYGDPIAMGTEPTVVVFQANENPHKPDDPRHWHAGIVYRQHVSNTPERALQALGETMITAGARLDVLLNSPSDDANPVTVIEGGPPMLPDVTAGPLASEDSNDG